MCFEQHSHATHSEDKLTASHNQPGREVHTLVIDEHSDSHMNTGSWQNGPAPSHFPRGPLTPESPSPDSHDAETCRVLASPVTFRHACACQTPS